MCMYKFVYKNRAVLRSLRNIYNEHFLRKNSQQLLAVIVFDKKLSSLMFTVLNTPLGVKRQTPANIYLVKVNNRNTKKRC